MVIIDIGLDLEKISEEELAEYIEDLVITNLKKSIEFDEINNLNVVVLIEKDNKLDIDISASIEMKENKKYDIQHILDQAIEDALKEFETKMRHF